MRSQCKYDTVLAISRSAGSLREERPPQSYRRPSYPGLRLIGEPSPCYPVAARRARVRAPTKIR